ncbi:hypothetical protein BJ508DRAFT_316058 [Ascobolus immersus RN42]|uniref:C2H2-type domain-containing protein n=1 Tax=Ascobolus immersus RN42 TaxID=1160509 RepID=A0A3N4HCY5_ASCIM|nr:hypothetical protein BJ508DRAFT_316058 [Ascobolus immersus RN42]
MSGMPSQKARVLQDALAKNSPKSDAAWRSATVAVWRSYPALAPNPDPDNFLLASPPSPTLPSRPEPILHHEHQSSTGVHPVWPAVPNTSPTNLITVLQCEGACHYCSSTFVKSGDIRRHIKSFHHRPHVAPSPRGRKKHARFRPRARTQTRPRPHTQPQPSRPVSSIPRIPIPVPENFDTPVPKKAVEPVLASPPSPPVQIASPAPSAPLPASAPPPPARAPASPAVTRAKTALKRGNPGPKLPISGLGK